MFLVKLLKGVGSLYVFPVKFTTSSLSMYINVLICNQPCAREKKQRSAKRSEISVTVLMLENSSIIFNCVVAFQLTR